MIEIRYGIPKVVADQLLAYAQSKEAINNVSLLHDCLKFVGNTLGTKFLGFERAVSLDDKHAFLLLGNRTYHGTVVLNVPNAHVKHTKHINDLALASLKQLISESNVVALRMV